MKRLRLFLYNIITIVVVMITVSACSESLGSQWVRTTDGTLFWASSVDTTMSFSWNGESFDGVANGKGTLSGVDSEENSLTQQFNMFYGASSIEDIVSMDDGSRFVGGIEDDKMEGFGVLDKGTELYIGSFHESKPNGYLKYYKKGKLFYDGNWKDGAFWGEGTLYKEDGSIKSGEWNNGTLIQTLVDKNLPEGHYYGYVRNGKPDGLGKMNYANSSLYAGKWHNGKWHGQGLYVHGADSIYGEWKSGKIGGDVIYRTPQLLFEGSFVDNVPVGEGNLVLSDGSYYSGCWLDGKRNGYGDMVFSNGDSYFGEWSNNTFHGTGTYKYAKEHAVYKGEWSKGLQHGNGYYKDLNFVYNGQWDQGWMDGDGHLYFKNGDKYEGTLHNNLLDGIGCYTYANGNRYEGEFVNGKINGLGVFHFKNGDRYEGEFVNGKIYGDGTMYLINKKETVAITGFWPADGSFPKEASILFANGDLYEGPLHNGVPTKKGTWISGKERQAKLSKVEKSFAHQANELFKKHRETINWCLIGASAVVTAVEVAAVSTGIGAPIAGLAHGVNVAINAADAGMAIASASMDIAENDYLGESNDEAIKTLGTELALNAAGILVPKVAKGTLKLLKTGVKNIKRSPVAKQLLKKPGAFLLKKTSFKFVRGKVTGKVVRLEVSINKGVRCVEKKLVRGKITGKSMFAMGRLLTRLKNQTVSYSSYLKQLKDNPALKDKLKMSVQGSSSNLRHNMNLCGTAKWFSKNVRYKRWLKLPKLHIEPHHIIPSNPTTEMGKNARNIWIKYFDSVDHPCNGIWLGRRRGAYLGLAKGSNHSPNSKEYEQKVAIALVNTFKKYKKQYAKDPDKMRQVLAETVDNIKLQIYKGEIAIGNGSHEVHSAWSIFKDKAASDVISNAARSITTKIDKIK